MEMDLLNVRDYIQQSNGTGVKGCRLYGAAIQHEWDVGEEYRSCFGVDFAAGSKKCHALPRHASLSLPEHGTVNFVPYSMDRRQADLPLVDLEQLLVYLKSEFRWKPEQWTTRSTWRQLHDS